jgi:hypothetical protein
MQFHQKEMVLEIDLVGSLVDRSLCPPLYKDSLLASADEKRFISF